MRRIHYFEKIDVCVTIFGTLIYSLAAYAMWGIIQNNNWSWLDALCLSVGILVSISAISGQIVGVLVAMAGQIIFDIVTMGRANYINVIGMVLIAFFIGLFSARYKAYCGRLGKRSLLFFVILQILLLFCVFIFWFPLTGLMIGKQQLFGQMVMGMRAFISIATVSVIVSSFALWAYNEIFNRYILKGNE